MDRKEQLDDLHRYLDHAAGELVRAHRTSTNAAHGIEGLDADLEAAMSTVMALRNLVRDALMRELARQPRKLPVV